MFLKVLSHLEMLEDVFDKLYRKVILFETGKLTFFVAYKYVGNRSSLKFSR